MRLIEDGRVIEGQAFDLEAIMADAGIPIVSRRAHQTIADKVMLSFVFSAMSRNRFNDIDDEGVYYAGTSMPAAIQEIRWHLENDDGVPVDKTRVYRSVNAKVTGRFLDLRGTRERALHPDPEKGYPAGQRMARKARRYCDGIIYPSARHPEGTCIAIFDPKCIEEIRLERLISFEPLPGRGREFGYRHHLQPHERESWEALSRQMTLSHA